ncbi:FAD-dependent oxidoreductase [Maritimibacter sp. 55A14]|uniref:tRNA (5-methylaminomethyl-2-thiouridine)(34)-methyltransferase MnmD n=1 Tax=Maritimibacter sp. 55A14 TaxID=2174844 RepID=UPI000D617B6B|nr:tRNA (5-methylaminomethyl-2-thiouridine)(34)-methyltransferase MnmD [Maritimibacter sp. 55A14]PWE32523.1 FAD-dependent oxidoreductase [Maritimibacter sp. 55A14]
MATRTRQVAETAEIVWREGGGPVSARFDDPYFSLQDGLAETRHVFLAGNGLPERMHAGFHIAELGFGTGLNLLAAWQCWLETGLPGRLRFTSFEAYPMRAADMARALGAFPALAPLTAPLLEAWSRGETRLVTESLEAQVILGDARARLPEWTGRADAWFLDGFAPARNPELWDAALLREVARHTAPGGSFATYTAAGHIRRALAQAGFAVTRLPGYGTKRHMTAGRLERHP